MGEVRAEDPHPTLRGNFGERAEGTKVFRMLLVERNLCRTPVIYFGSG